MAAKERRTRTSVKKALYENACGFNFFKAVHLLEGYIQGDPLGKKLSPRNDPVRFRVRPGFTFPASDIYTLQSGHAHAGPEMTVNFMGLIGPKGVLPDWYNAYAQELNHNKDYAFTDFLDLFHHRLISLFYLAWKKYRLVENYLPDARDPISNSIASFVGIGGREKKVDPDFDRMNRRRLIFFSGMAARTVPTASAIEAIIANAVGVTVCVRQFVERMIPIHEQDRTRLGQTNSTLKKDALCGGRIRDAGSFFIVELGPMSWEKYLSFQPRSRNMVLVRKLITFIVGLEYEFQIRLILNGEDIPGLPLGGGGKGAPVLGRTVLLKWPEKPYRKNVVINEIQEHGENEPNINR
jgi:type VI secretion system protein ImpH